MMPNCDIEELKKENKKLKERIDFLETSFDFDIGRLQEEVKILKNKLKDGRKMFVLMMKKHHIQSRFYNDSQALKVH